ncbi:DUF397 domain-containing protein [Solwaraspora sp. WMMD1047]|uniref:DUF397 domain-containing protein n=1 Tax=Solwaraspora sp. WMMD1047 TaxID=3016102 RepID=UPI002415D068|nr:DUF397 domain-containing protein [Solwaraspora sp. WMMD1047]MDG4829197.1 DUF397 domain-containing protein [Solwaraspora sp. WMMD1047]
MSTRTDGNNACVAVQMAGDVVGVCDSKAGHDGAVLAFEAPQWRRFTRAVQLGVIVRESAAG